MIYCMGSIDKQAKFNLNVLSSSDSSVPITDFRFRGRSKFAKNNTKNSTNITGKKSMKPFAVALNRISSKIT